MIYIQHNTYQSHIYNISIGIVIATALSDANPLLNKTTIILYFYWSLFVVGNKLILQTFYESNQLDHETNIKYSSNHLISISNQTKLCRQGYH